VIATAANGGVDIEPDFGKTRSSLGRGCLTPSHEGRGPSTPTPEPRCALLDMRMTPGLLPREIGKTCRQSSTTSMKAGGPDVSL
jgi:hypothetical protein